MGDCGQVPGEMRAPAVLGVCGLFFLRCTSYFFFLLTLQAAEPPMFLSFEKNQGQAPASVQYLARIPGGQVFFTAGDVIFTAPGREAVSLRFPGAAGQMTWQPMEREQETVSYFVGSDASRWVRNAPVYRRIVCRDLYPGVDAVFYEKNRQLEYDLVVAPGADVARVRLAWSEAKQASETIVAGLLQQHRPEVYQTTAAGERKAIEGRFVPTERAGEFRLALGRFDATRPLVIDPVLEMFTYVGGESDDEVIAVGPGYVVGNTSSILFPTAPVERRRSRDVFVRGTGAVSTVANARVLVGTLIFGGVDDDEVGGAALLDLRAASIQVVGTTRRTAPEEGYHGGASDGFVATVTFTDRGVVLSEYVFVGGSGEDRLKAVAVSDFREYAAVGVTDSPDLPTTGAQQTSLAGGRDAFYVISDNRQPKYGYLGGSGGESANTVTWLGVSQVLLGGETSSGDLPARAENTADPGSGSNGFFALVTRSVEANGNGATTFTTWYFGGQGEDRIEALVCTAPTATQSLPAPIRLTAPPCAFTGTTTSPDLALVNPTRATYAGGRDVFIGTLDWQTRRVLSLTYWGGSGDETARGIAMNWAGDLWVVGSTRSEDFPTTDAFQGRPGGGEDGFLVLLERNGSVRQSTYFGGAGDDRVNGVQVGRTNLAQIVGGTSSTNLPETKGGQVRGAGQEGFIAELGTAYLIGPDEVILPRDGAITLSLRSATAPSVLVTYRSSDPTRLRVGAGAEQVTAMVDSNVQLEALAGEGEAELIATATGFPEKRIRVRLYPSVLQVGGAVARVSRWAGTVTNWFPLLRAVDPATGRVVGPSAVLRSGLANQPVRWSSSDASVISVTDLPPTGVTAQVRREGSTTIAYEVASLRSEPWEMTVVAPELFPLEAIVGENLVTTFTPAFQLQGNVAFPNRGTITYRSEDTTRLRVSSDGEWGREAVTLPLANQIPLYLHGLASSGTVQLIVTSTEFTGERLLQVRLEPAMVRFSLYSPEGEGKLKVEQTANLSFAMTTSSAQNRSMRLAPGAPPIVVKLESSDPGVLELNRLTVTIPSSENYTVTGLKAGTSLLKLSGGSNVTAEPRELRVTVEEKVTTPVAPTLPKELVVGKDLQTAVQFRYYRPADQPVARITVDDPTVAVVSASGTAPGSQQADVPVRPADEYAFWIQGLQERGETRVRVRLGNEPEQVIRVILAPSAIGMINRQTALEKFDIAPVPLEDRTGAALAFQGLRPGVKAQVSLRVEGAPLTLTPASLTLDHQTSLVSVAYKASAAPSEVIIEAPGFTTSPRVSRVTLAGGPALNLAAPSGSPVAAYPGITAFDVSTFSGVTWPLKVTSLTPEVLLVSASLNEPGSESIRLAAGGRFYLQGLRAGALGSIRVEGPSSATLETNVMVYPRRAERSTNGSLIEGQEGLYRLYLSAGPTGGTVTPVWVAKGEPALRFAIRSANPEILTVAASTLEIREGQAETSVTLKAGASGVTEVLTEAPEGVELASGRTPVVVRKPALSGSGLSNGEVSVGRNIQVALSLTAEQRSSTGTAQVTSGDPARLVISRSSLTPGAASATVNVQDGRVETIFLQALEGSGEVPLRVSLPGYAETVITVILRPSWLRLSRSGVTLTPGERATLTVEAAYEAAGGDVAGNLRPGLGTVSFGLRADRDGVVTGLPASGQLGADGRATFTITGAANGEVILGVDGTPLFDATSPSRFSRVVVAATSPGRINVDCGGVLGHDTQRECFFSGVSGLTVRSEDPTKVLVSTDTGQPGRAEVTPGRNSFVLQGLAAVGTTELILNAPGYAETRFAVVHRPTYVALEGFSSAPSSFTIARGSRTSRTLALQLTPPYGTLTPRAGLQLPVTLTVEPAGIVKIDPASLAFGPARDSQTFTIEGLAVGAATVRMAAPGHPGSPLTTFTVRVTQ